MTAETKRDRAVASVTRNASPEFRALIENAVRTVATTRSRFISDDVWVFLEKHFPTTIALFNSHNEDRRALGGIMRRMARRGVITQTGNFIRSERRHMTPMPEWRLA